MMTDVFVINFEYRKIDNYKTQNMIKKDLINIQLNMFA